VQVILLFLPFSLFSGIERDLQDRLIEKTDADILFLNAAKIGCHDDFVCMFTDQRP
jgi:hypothetical protein